MVFCNGPGKKQTCLQLLLFVVAAHLVYMILTPCVDLIGSLTPVAFIKPYYVLAVFYKLGGPHW